MQAALLGTDVTMLGKLGRDSNAQEILAACKAAGVHTEHMLFDETESTGCAMIIWKSSRTAPHRTVSSSCPAPI